uniref:Uncharacterized protein n=1 Tax=Araneus ventricosus TaxID=182803 RepID=A0A4Y2BQ11_ARAVE|nr:hypothetical protein AVEN_78145-1 [Araneus ventricosus]
MAGDTLAQASVIRFRSSCNVGGVVAYTCCLMYPHRKKSNGFRSGERGGHSTQPPNPMTCCWNMSRMYYWTLDTWCGGAPSCCNDTFRRSLNGKSSRKSNISSFLFSFLPRYVTLQFWELRTKKNMHLTPSIFNITVRKVSPFTKWMMLKDFAIDFFPYILPFLR